MRAPLHYLRRVVAAAEKTQVYRPHHVEVVAGQGPRHGHVAVLVVIRGKFVLRSCGLSEDPVEALAAFATLLEEIEDHCFNIVFDGLICAVAKSLKEKNL